MVNMTALTQKKKQNLQDLDSQDKLEDKDKEGERQVQEEKEREKRQQQGEEE